MKTINTYINEKLKLTTKQKYTCQPKDKNELQQIILQRIDNEGTECELNDIDTSKITDMSNLFDKCYFKYADDFNCDISLWNVSNVNNMYAMFFNCNEFNCDLSMWDVSNVKDMYAMFYKCYKFNCDISNWNVPNVKDIRHMFENCKEFNQDLNRWNVSNVEYMVDAFNNCPTQPDWYK